MSARRVLVTGAGGFVGGHVARRLAASGWEVRGLSRRPPSVEPEDPPIDWLIGDLVRPEDRRRALEGVRFVVHSAGWVRLGRDRSGQALAVNVGATQALLEAAEASGVERLVYTSSLWTVAAGTPERPADEDTPWNLQVIQSPYAESKRQAERLVLEHDGRRGLRTLVLCPSLVVGPRDVRPTSTRLLLQMAATPVAVLPRGGIPVVDASVLSMAHERALEVEPTGRRLIVAGPYLSYLEMARLVALVAGWPRRLIVVPEFLRGLLGWTSGLVDRLGLSPSGDVSAAAVAGGFLRLHASGARANALLGLSHPPPIRSIFEALDDHRRSGRAAWLDLRRPDQ